MPNIGILSNSSRGLAVLLSILVALTIVTLPYSLTSDSTRVKKSILPSAEAATSSCKCVVYRIDDIQDNWIDNPQMSVMDLYVSKNQHLSLGVIMHLIGADTTLINKMKQGAQNSLFALDVHGWDHVDYTTLTLQQQEDSLVLANNKMQSLFGSPSITFDMPYDTFNADTLSAMQAVKMKIISSRDYYDTYPFFNAGGSASYDGNALPIVHMPGTAMYADYNPSVKGGWLDEPSSKILSDIDASIAKYGYAVLVIHPQSFAQVSSAGDLTNVVNQTQIARMSDLMDAVSAKGIVSTTFESILNGNPTTIGTSLTINPIAAVQWGQNVSVTGKLSFTNGTGIAGATISFTGNAISVFPSVVTSSDGSFTAMGPSPSLIGSWTVQAHYAGDSTHPPANSNVLTYQTVAHTTALSLGLTPTSVSKNGVYSVSAVLKDATTNTFLGGKTITFVTKAPLKIASGTTDVNTGTLTEINLAAPNKSGSYDVVANFSGEPLYAASQSSKVILTVK